MSYNTHIQQKHTLPNQQHSIPTTGTQNHIPKIAFVYENSYQNNKQTQDQKINKLKNNNNDTIIQKFKSIDKINVNSCNTPKKIENKQNMFLNVPNKGNSYHSNRYQHQNIVNLQNNNQSSSKRSSSPLNCKLPPHSPKSASKKLFQKCPSNLTQKEKDPVQNENQLIFETICKCGKNISHQVIKTSQKCCSTCGIAKMIQGLQLQPYSPINLRKSQIYLSQIQNSKLNKYLNQKNKQQFFKQIKQQKLTLQNKYKESLENQQKNIHIFYKQKKLELKNHYQKIKLAIKQSIQQDLKQIQNMEKQTICEHQNFIQNLLNDIKKITKIQKCLQKNSNILNQNKICKQIFDEFQQILSKNKTQILNRNSKIDNEPDTLTISGISNVPSNASFMTTTMLKNMNLIGNQMYKSSIYRMLSSKTIIPRLSDLSTESKIQGLKKQIEISKMEQKRNKMQNKNNLLYSFERK